MQSLRPQVQVGFRQKVHKEHVLADACRRHPGEFRNAFQENDEACVPLVKVPQLAVRDNTGAEILGYRNIWEWIMLPGRLKARERGGTRANPPPEAVLKWAQQAITLLANVLSERVALKITFPRVEGYTQAIRSRIACDWENVPPLKIDPLHIPTEIEMRGLCMTDRGRLTMSGPGRASQADLEEFRKRHRTQQLMFGCAQRLTREYCAQPGATIAPHTLSPQLVPVVERYLRELVEVMYGGNLKDAFLSPHFSWLIEVLCGHLRPDQAQGEAPEIPRYEENRMEGSTADMDTWTSKDVREVVRSHVNFVIADTQQWEKAAAFIL